MCSKQYSSENAYENHLLSKKHKDLASTFSEKGKANAEPSLAANSNTEQRVPNWRTQIGQATSQQEIEEIIVAKLESAVRLDECECLFCSHCSSSFDDNIIHMTKAHSFFVPDIEFLVDLKGMFTYLAEKVSIMNLCLYCNGKGKAFHTIESVRKHMVNDVHNNIFLLLNIKKD